MNFWKRLFHKAVQYQTLEESEEPDFAAGRESLDVNDAAARRKYVEDALERMKDASLEVERLKDEYQLVNAYLKDMEELEALPYHERELVEEHARAILMLDGDKQRLSDRSSVMAESDYRRMERLEEEVTEGIGKLREAEDYQAKIKKDLQRLEGEKHACAYRISESAASLANVRGMAVICMIASAACFVVLFLLETLLSLNARVGYLMTAVAAAVVLTVFFLRYKEADKEYHTASGSYNKVILLQNKVKIRYINNTQLLEYYYIKYGSGSADQLEKLWEKYQVEKEERKKVVQAEADLDFHSERLVRQLKNYHLFDPVIWVHQTKALLDPKEMVEVRHGLIMRRQKLRGQIDYNNETGYAAKEEITALVREYPRYAEEILDMVSVYERRYNLH